MMFNDVTMDDKVYTQQYISENNLKNYALYNNFNPISHTIRSLKRKDMWNKLLKEAREIPQFDKFQVIIKNFKTVNKLV